MWRVEPGHLGPTPDFAVVLGKITSPSHACVVLASAEQELTANSLESTSECAARDDYVQVLLS